MGNIVSYSANILVARPQLDQATIAFTTQCNQLAQAIKQCESDIVRFATSNEDDSACIIGGNKIEVFMEVNKSNNTSVKAFAFLVNKCTGILSPNDFLSQLRNYVRQGLKKDNYDMETLSILIAYDGSYNDIPHLDIGSGATTEHAQDPSQQYYQFTLILSQQGTFGTEYATSYFKPTDLSDV